MSSVQQAVKTALEQPLKLDIGCGKNKKEGFYGVDIIDFDGVDIVADLRQPRWRTTKLAEPLRGRLDVTAISPSGAPDEWKFFDNSVDEVHCAHFLEHLTNLGDRWERVNFFNELFRVMKPGAQCQLIFPHWASNRFYGDPTHKEPFSEMGFYYLKRAWRIGKKDEAGNWVLENGQPLVPQAPHTDISVNPNGYSCDFDATWGYTLHPGLANRNQDYVMHAMSFWKEACQDMSATLVKPLTPR